MPAVISMRPVTEVCVTAMVGGTFTLTLGQDMRFAVARRHINLPTGRMRVALIGGLWTGLVYTLAGPPDPDPPDPDPPDPDPPDPDQPDDVVVSYVEALVDAAGPPPPSPPAIRGAGLNPAEGGRLHSPMRKIDAFAHILPRAYLAQLERQLEQTMAPSQLDYYREGVFAYDPVLTDLDARWRQMDQIAQLAPAGAYQQVLVLAVPPLEEVGPPAVAAELARLANDELAALVRRFPDRFVGFAAALPLSDVEAATRELDRALTELGALGAQLYTNVLGVPLDEPRFEPLFARLEVAGRAVWLHPTRSAAWADYPAERTSDYGLWWSLGWPYETAAALARLVYSGHLERHPRQLIIAHHGGGMVPHFAARLAMGPGYRQVKDTLPRPPLDYFRRFYVDTALFGAPHAVRCVLEFFGPRHVLFGTDMPLGPASAVEATMADLEAAELSGEDRAAVYAGNAVRLFGLRAS